jgi:hypothetical protein
VDNTQLEPEPETITGATAPPVPRTIWPIAIVPVGAEVVRAVPEIDPVNDAVVPGPPIALGAVPGV